MSRLAGIKPLNRPNLCTRASNLLKARYLQLRGHHDWPVKWAYRKLAPLPGRRLDSGNKARAYLNMKNQIAASRTPVPISTIAPSLATWPHENSGPVA